MNLLRSIKENKIGNKRKTKDNLGPLLNETGGLVTQDTEEAEVMNASFASVFTNETSLREFRVPETGGKCGASKVYPWWKRIRSGSP